MTQMKQLIRIAYYPTLLIAAVLTFFLLKKDFAGEKLPLLVLMISAATIVIVHISERLLPYRKAWNIPRGDLISDFTFTNIALPVLSKSVELILGFIFISKTSGFIHTHIHSLWPREWPLLAQLVLILLICEFFFYWVHRLGHTIPRLWKFHSIHHVVERLYWNNAGVFHPLDLFFNWLLYFFPLFLFGVSPELIALFLLMNAVTGLLEHANIDFEMGFMNRIFNTAQLHRWHHSVIPEVSSQNFGKVLSVWDQVFGTWYCPEGEHVGKLGVEGENIPTSIAGQMIYPFKK